MAVEGWLSVAWSGTQVSGKSCLGGALVPGRFAESFGSLGVSRRSERGLENHLAVGCLVGVGGCAWYS
jgi:hypothetical protein